MPMPSKSPEDGIRELLRMRRPVGIDGDDAAKPAPLPAGESAELGRDPFASVPPKVKLPPMYSAGPVYAGLRDPAPLQMLVPEEYVEGVTFDPPSNRERIAAAHQKRIAQQRGMGR